uniref:Mitochondrial ribonuclease P catalytic subunit n=1 Tax=Lynceus sp. MCZ IZ 141354 TaxID=1930659 RepID=A0A9N6WUU8_9CRUS|nr:EOG090X0CGF [Lynceus sp. MCZ IZ 141354]
MRKCFALTRMCSLQLHPTISNSRILNQLPRFCSEDSAVHKYRKSNAEYLYPLMKELLPTCASYDELKTKVIEKSEHVNNHNFDALVLRYCNAELNFELGCKFMEYLYTNRPNGPNTASLSKFLQLAHKAPEKIPLQLIEKSCEMLSAKAELLDQNTAQVLVTGLSHTDRWKEGLKHLKMIYELGIPTAAVLDAIALAALKHNKMDIALKMMNNVAELEKQVSEPVFESWMSRSQTFSDIETLLQFLSTSEMIPTLETIKQLQSWLEKHNYTWHYSTSTRKGTCSNCGHAFQRAELTTEEYKLLQKGILEKVLTGEDIFRRSTPAEVKSFREFVAKTAPYDVILDALNVLYCKGKPTGKTNALTIVVKDLMKKGKKVLVLGRNHIRRNTKFLPPGCNVFTINDLSFDDAFVLYAALSSGPNAFVVSRDLMRNHAFRLRELGLHTLFKRWQRSHQFLVANIQGEKVIYTEPETHVTAAQFDLPSRTWHVPYDDGQERLNLEVPKTWLCIPLK